MKSIKCLFFVLLAAGAASCLSLRAAAAQIYLDEYNLYKQALVENNKAAAAEHGYAAWRSADTELGDHRLTGMLALNHARLVLYDDPVAALPALKRASELANKGLFDPTDNDLELMTTYAEFEVSGGATKDRDILREVLLERASLPRTPTLDEADMWFALATREINDKHYRDAELSARKAEAALTAVYPSNYRLIATTALYQGLVEITRKTTTRNNVLAAFEHFDRAVKMFPKQKDLESFDQVLVQAISWSWTAAAVYDAYDFNPRSRPEINYDSGFFEGPTPTDEECAIEWAEREPPKYPDTAIKKGYSGAVLIGYMLGDNLAIKDVRVLGEVPGDEFSSSVLTQVQDWSLKHPPKDLPGCAGPHLTYLTFIFR